MLPTLILSLFSLYCMNNCLFFIFIYKNMKNSSCIKQMRTLVNVLWKCFLPAIFFLSLCLRHFCWLKKMEQYVTFLLYNFESNTKKEMFIWSLGLCLFITGVTGLVSTDRNNARFTDFSLWGMTNLKTGQYAVSTMFTNSVDSWIQNKWILI